LLLGKDRSGFAPKAAHFDVNYSLAGLTEAARSRPDVILSTLMLAATAKAGEAAVDRNKRPFADDWRKGAFSSHL